MKQALLAAAILFSQAAFAQDTLRVSSDQTVGGFVFPESCGYDAKGKALYVGNFGGANSSGIAVSARPERSLDRPAMAYR